MSKHVAVMTALGAILICGSTGHAQPAPQMKAAEDIWSGDGNSLSNPAWVAASSKSASSSSKSKSKSSPSKSRAGSAHTTSRAAAPAPYYGDNTAYINPTQFDEITFCQMILEMTNAERTRRGLSPVAPNSAAAAAATQHSRDMASRGYFDHKSKGILSRSNPTTRMAAYGYRPRLTAENIAMMPTFNNQLVQYNSDHTRSTVAVDYNTYGRLAQYTMQEWMNSPGHRVNILNPRLTTLGVGAAIGMRSNVPYVYVTQDFGG